MQYIIKNTKEIEGLLIEIEPGSLESKLTEREQLKNAMKELKMEHCFNKNIKSR